MAIRSWGNYPKIPSCARPFEYCRDAVGYFEQEPAFIPHGNGRSYGDSALGEQVVTMRDHDWFQSFDALTGQLVVSSGVLLSEILRVMVPKGWFLKVVPGTKFVTVGGAIASDVHGKNHHNAGCFSESVLWFKLMLPNGQLATCSTSENPELFRATCGGMGLTGIIVEAALQLKTIHSRHIVQELVITENLEDTFSAFESHSSQEYSVAWIDCMAQGDKLGRSVLNCGHFSSDGCLTKSQGNTMSVPFNFPSFALNKFSVSAFNELYYWSNKRKAHYCTVDYESFFFPLDSILSWNRIYGKQGFVQYQFILPKEVSFNVIAVLLRKISAAKMGSFLAVLKLYGPENENFLSFPMEGYSLALDFKLQPGLFDFLTELDEIVVTNGGRIYLAKDARMSKAHFQASYPRLQKFIELREKFDMHTQYQSAQSIRLGL